MEDMQGMTKEDSLEFIHHGSRNHVGVSRQDLVFLMDHHLESFK